MCGAVENCKVDMSKGEICLPCMVQSHSVLQSSFWPFSSNLDDKELDRITQETLDDNTIKYIFQSGLFNDFEESTSKRYWESQLSRSLAVKQTLKSFLKRNQSEAKSLKSLKELKQRSSAYDDILAIVDKIKPDLEKLMLRRVRDELQIYYSKEVNNADNVATQMNYTKAQNLQLKNECFEKFDSSQSLTWNFNQAKSIFEGNE